MNDRVEARLAVLDNIIELGGEGRLPRDLHDRSLTVGSQARARLGHGTTNTVVALAGGTGSGKSSLLNAIVGSQVAASSVRRPTTSVAQAVVFGEPADALCDWLQIDRRTRVDEPDLAGLVLLDLPDHDSTVAAHQAEVDRLVEVVDVFCWVVDPQKYADAALHQDYLARFAGHGAVTIVVLNQADRLSPADQVRCLEDLRRLLGTAGFSGVRVMASSAVTGEGVVELRRELSARVAERRAVIARLDADLDWLGTDLLGAATDATLRPVASAERDRVADAATAAAGGDAVADSVEASMRHRAGLTMGWPPIRWVGKLRPDPLKRLGLGTKEMKANASSSFGTTVRRTALGANPAGQAILANEVRAVGRDIGSVAPPAARERLDLVAAGTLPELPDQLDQAIGSTELPVTQPRWWHAIGVVQNVVALAMIVGLLWLALIAVLDWLRVPELPLPKYQGWPLPTLLAIGGAVLGLLIALIARRGSGLAARRRGRQARALLRSKLTAVVDERVVAPLNKEVTALNRLADLIRRFSG